MKYQIEIDKYLSTVVTATLEVTEIDEDVLAATLDSLEDYRYSPEEIAMQLVQRLPNVLTVSFEGTRHRKGVETKWYKKDDAPTSSK